MRCAKDTSLRRNPIACRYTGCVKTAGGAKPLAGRPKHSQDRWCRFRGDIYMLHFMLDFVGLILSSVALSFVLSAKRNGKLKNVNKAIFFLALDIGIEVVEDAVRWLKKITFTADGVTLEIVTLTLTILALYYVVSAKDKKKVEPLNVGSWCIGCVVLAEFLEMGLPFAFGI